MKYIGYHRTSTKEQHIDRGLKEINDYCDEHNIKIKKIYCDQTSGKNFDRSRYVVMKEDVLEPGDVLIVTELDRLGRNKEATLRELRYYKENNIRVMVLELPTTLVDISAMENSMARMMMETINNMMIELYASMSQAEYEKRKKRQKEGIESKKIRGEWSDYGRPRVITMDEFAINYKEVLAGKVKPYEMMKKLDLKEATYYKYRKEYTEKYIKSITP